MAIKVNGTTVIDDSRNLVNIVSGAGSSTTFGDVGTYTAGFGANNTEVTEGDTISGSLLRHFKSNQIGSSFRYNVNGGDLESTGLSGTWRAMSHATVPSFSTYTSAALWVRIS